MLIRHSSGKHNFLIACWLVLAGLCFDHGRASADPTDDHLLELNEALVLYNTEGEENYRAANEIFSRILERNPQEPTALLFRALSYGELGLARRLPRAELQTRVGTFEEILAIRGEAGRAEELEKELEALRAQQGAEGLPAAEKFVLEESIRVKEEKLAAWRDRSGLSNAELEARLAEARGELQKEYRTERELFRQMLTDMDALIAALSDPQAVVRLVDVVARSKVARMDEERALLLSRTGAAAEPDDTSATMTSLRQTAAESLRQAAALLESQLADGFARPEDAVRTKFFLGVIRFRQALPRRTQEEPPDRDALMLAESERIMSELAADASVDQAWRSYAVLYLGLILPVRAGDERDGAARQDLFDEALRRLQEAAELDVKTDEAGREQSASRMAIPEIVAKQRESIAEWRTAAASGFRPRNDISLTLSTGFHRDTNVVLLGERTDLPRGVSDPEDFGFPAAVLIDYTYDFNEKWALGAQARTTQLWHAEIDEFDEQRYGASVALQYRLMPQTEEFGPVYLRLQYDYDYTLLGKSAFLDNHSLSPNLRIYWADARAQTDFYAQFERRDYREQLTDRRFDRDGNYISVGVVQSYQWVSMNDWYKSRGIEAWGFADDDALWQDNPDIERRWLTPYVGLEYSWDSTKGDEFDQKEIALRGGVLLPLPYGIDLDGGMQFQWQDYAHGSLVDFHRRSRRDFIQEYTLGLTRTFVVRPGAAENRFTPVMDRVLMTIRAHVSWTDDDSNVVNRPGAAIFSYDRAVYGISMAFSFN